MLSQGTADMDLHQVTVASVINIAKDCYPSSSLTHFRAYDRPSRALQELQGSRLHWRARIAIRLRRVVALRRENHFDNFGSGVLTLFSLVLGS
jgi:hypothetical protein